MKKSILNIKGATAISKKDQSEINGGILSVAICGCDCGGNITGLPFCVILFGCTQAVRCNEES